MPRGRQAVKAIIALVGPQDVTVTAHRPGSDGAAVGVRVGGSLIYINDLDTVQAFHAAWRSGIEQGRTLPTRPDPDLVRPVWGVSEPVVMMSAADVPPSHARLERTPGRPACLWITLGRVVFGVHDQLALRSAAAAFRQAEQLAATTFLPEPDLSVRYRAEATVQRLLNAPRRAGPDRATPAAAAAAPSPQRVLRMRSERAR